MELDAAGALGQGSGVASRWGWMGLSVAVLAAAGVAWPVSSPAGAPLAWVDRGLHVVGGPVPAGGRVVVLVSAPDRSVWLEAVDAKTGAVEWKVPEEFSGITAGVVTAPAVDDGIVLALVPAGRATSPLVRLEGVRVASGAVAWRGRTPAVATDAPTSCPLPLGSRAFCLVAASSASKPPALVALSASSGMVEATVPRIQRSMSTTPGLYQTSDRPSVLVGVRTPGGTAWGQRVSALFGAGYDPDYGWEFDRLGAVEAGSVGRTPVGGNTVALDTGKTVGLSNATGKHLWSDRGVFECFGVDELPGPWLCRFTGTATATASGKITASADATLTLEGFDPVTGGIRWRVPTAHNGIAALLRGDVAFADANHLLVPSQQGRGMVLDLRSGVTSLPAPGQVFWCAHANFFTITPPLGVGAQRVGSSRYSPCDAAGHAVTRPPSTSVPAIARTAGMRVWASPIGLEAVRG
jgi:outer membrane protein assembly factor BamB